MSSEWEEHPPKCKNLWLTFSGNPITEKTKAILELQVALSKYVRQRKRIRLWLNPLLMANATKIAVRYGKRKVRYPIKRTVYNNVRQVSVEEIT